jgi:hypothetical protein
LLSPVETLRIKVLMSPSCKLKLASNLCLHIVKNVRLFWSYSTEFLCILYLSSWLIFLSGLRNLDTAFFRVINNSGHVYGLFIGIIILLNYSLIIKSRCRFIRDGKIDNKTCLLWKKKLYNTKVVGKQTSLVIMIIKRSSGKN